MTLCLTLPFQYQLHQFNLSFIFILLHIYLHTIVTEQCWTGIYVCICVLSWSAVIHSTQVINILCVMLVNCARFADTVNSNMQLVSQIVTAGNPSLQAPVVF